MGIAIHSSIESVQAKNYRLQSTARIFNINLYSGCKSRHWDPARIWIWVFGMLVRCSCQLRHWSSGTVADDRWHLSIDTAQFPCWISLVYYDAVKQTVIRLSILYHGRWNLLHTNHKSFTIVVAFQLLVHYEYASASVVGMVDVCSTCDLPLSRCQ